MPSRALTLFVTLLIAAQSVLGGLGYGVSVCLGGGHVGVDAVDVERVIECSHGCSHGEVSLPRAVPTAMHSQTGTDGCGCIDVELSDTHLVLADRPQVGGDDGADESDAATSVMWMVTIHEQLASLRPRAVPRTPMLSPGAQQRPAGLIRLNI